MDLCKPCYCPHCADLMEVRLPFWYRPDGGMSMDWESLDWDSLDWDSNNKQSSDNWWCHTCGDHHFPVDNDEAIEAGDQRERWFRFAVTMATGRDYE